MAYAEFTYISTQHSPEYVCTSMLVASTQQNVRQYLTQKVQYCYHNIINYDFWNAKDDSLNTVT